MFITNRAYLIDSFPFQSILLKHNHILNAFNPDIEVNIKTPDSFISFNKSVLHRNIVITHSNEITELSFIYKYIA